MSDMLNELLNVGLTKAIGYLPIEAIEKNGSSYLEIMIKLKKKGIKTRYFKEEECNTESGALFAFHNDALVKILQENREAILQAGWPIEADNFINYLIKNTAPRGTTIFSIIKKAYGK